MESRYPKTYAQKTKCSVLRNKPTPDRLFEGKVKVSAGALLLTGTYTGREQLRQYPTHYHPQTHAYNCAKFQPLSISLWFLDLCCI